VGLTGSIGMGKSTISQHLTSLGFPVFDADLEVHRLYAKGGSAVTPMGEAFPDAVVDGAVDRAVLSAAIIADISGTVLRRIEAIVHPLVIEGREAFYAAAQREGRLMVIYDIPLLFENMHKYQVDYIIVATAAEEVQRARVLQRPGMTVEKFEAILSKQVPDAEKRAQAHYLVHTDHSYAEGKAQVAAILESIIDKHPALWEQWKNGGVELAERCAVEAPITSTVRTVTSTVRTLTSTVDSTVGSTGDSTVGIEGMGTGAGMGAGASLPGDSLHIRSRVDLVLFDLDDTLVPVMNQITAAMEALKVYMGEHMPLSAAQMHQLRGIMMRVVSECPLLAHDLTEVRRRAMREVAGQYGEEGRVDEAMELFVRVRSDVAPHLYDDVIECFDWLQAMNIPIGVLTNGNADLSACPTLGRYLSLSLGAGEIGSCKPSRLGFIACAQLLNASPSRVLYVGDSYDKDVVGARACGMMGALLLRGAGDTAAAAGTAGAAAAAADYSEAHLILTGLTPVEMQAKLSQLFRT